jgi:hypothetical protein
MIDFEERLRADLELAVDGYQAAIDPEEVLRAGKAARRTRNLHRVAAVGALVVALFGVSVVAAPPLIAKVLDSQTVEVSSSFTWNKTRSEFDQISVQLKRRGGVLSATAIGQLSGTVLATKSWELPQRITEPVRLAFGSRAVIVVFPGQVAQSEIIAGLQGSGGGTEWMPSFGVTVTATQLEKAAARPDGLDWVWVDESGAARSIDGTTLGATVTLADKRYVVYRSEKSNTLGVLGSFSFRLSDLKESSLLDGAVAWGGAAKVSWQLGSLPAGAHDLQLTLSKPDGEWAAVALSDGSVVVVATVPGDRAQVVTSLSYLRADGTRVKFGH